MTKENIYDAQFKFKQDYYLKNLDFVNWYRYFFIIKEVLDTMPGSILEVGTGGGIVKNCLKPLVGRYSVLDINPELQPDILGDIRVRRDALARQFDCAIIADVLEHIPLTDVEKCLRNLHSYLKNQGKALITIPHRRSNFLLMTPTNKPRVITVPTGFLSAGAFYRRFLKRKIWIDPAHLWEIGDGKTRKRDIEMLFKKSGFTIEKFQKLIYVDFWVLNKDK